jgi:PBP1b-binding outer membrane lipoprotein LpoB
MKKTTWIILLLVTAMLLSACQPTPKVQIVVNKGGDAMEQMVKQTSDPSAQSSAYTAPENWKEDINNENGESFIKIDAPVNMPDVDKYPVIEVKPGKFS